MQENIPILQLRDVSVRYDKEEAVLEHCSLQLNAGEFGTLIGRSGAGKTSIFNCICSFIPYQGTIQRPMQIAHVFQDKSVFPWMRVKSNILYGVAGDKEHKATVLQTVLQQTGLVGLENRYPYQLSGGQQRRVAIGQALATGAALILLDEPFTGLDGETKDEVVDWLLSHVDRQRSFLAILHDKEDAILLSDVIWDVASKKITEVMHISVPRNERTQLRRPEIILPYITTLTSISTQQNHSAT